MDTPSEYVKARSVLLDAAQALNSHLSNLILVGAQAIYLHTGDADLAQPPMTTDADLALDTTGLAGEPDIAGALRRAGFSPGKNPGCWIGSGYVAVDIMVVPAQSGRSKKNARGARIPPHANNTARITAGLEPALIDHGEHPLAALTPDDDRKVRLKVAGPAALLIAKAVKIDERMKDAAEGHPARLKEKDALDIYRLLRSVATDTLVDGVRKHLADAEAAAVTQLGLRLMRNHGADARALLPTLATRAAAGDPVVAPSFAILANELLTALDST